MPSLRVLILEDNPLDLELVLYHLRQAGFDPIWQQAGSEAEFAARLTPDLDLILADYHLPRFDGLQALRLLQARQLDVPFILISGTIQEETAVTLIKAGAADYLLKDRLVRLGPAVKQALEQQALRRQKREVENALCESEQRYRHLVENSPDGIAVHVAGRLVYINPAGVRLIGAADPETILGRPVIDFVHPDHQPSVQARLARLEHGRTLPLLEEKFVCLDGREIDVEVSAAPFTFQNQAAVQVIFRDISARKQAEAELRQTYQTLQQSEERFRVTFEQAAVGISHSALNGQFLRVNQKFCDILGYTRPELLDLTFQAITHPDDLAESQQQVRRLVLGEVQTYHLEKRYLHKNGTSIWVNITISLARSPTGEPLYFIGVVEDITERRRLEQQFRQAQKMEAIGQLAGGIAHDINNILVVVMGYADLLLRRLTETDPLRNGVTEIFKACERAAALTRQLLTFSRQETVQPQILSLNKIVLDMDHMLRRLIGEDIDLVIEVAPQAGSIKADPGHIEQVILNLAINARDALPQGGRLMIRTVNVQLDEQGVRRHGGVRAGDYVALIVADTGIGMDQATQAHIFEPFFTTKEPGKGTGLGLATVYGIVTQSGGHIAVESAPDRGTEFKVYFPRLRNTVTSPQADLTPAALPGGTETILLVEDEEPVRRLTCQVLQGCGYSVLTAGDGPEALRIYQAHSSAIRLLVTDVIMPHMDGFSLVEALRRHTPQIRVLFLSGYAPEAKFKSALTLSEADFLAKPFTPFSLTHKVRRLLDQSCQISQ